MWSPGRSIVLCGVIAVLTTIGFLLQLQAERVEAIELPTLALRTSPDVAFGPADVEIVVIAKPDDANRILAVSLSSSDSGYSRSSQQTLAGELEAGQLARMTYRDVPPGRYLVVATLFTREGKPRAQRANEVRRLPRGE